MKFLVLTAARTGEVLAAIWDEIDLGVGVWTIPAARIKVGKKHRVPLSERALDILQKLHGVRSGSYVFPGFNAGKPSPTWHC